jgi:RNA polymerase sigma factor (sigma-70 family)
VIAVNQRRAPRVSDETIMPSTVSLTAAMARGDEAAVDTFYRGYFDWLFAQARRASARRCDEASCLDIVQDAVLRIVRTVRRVETEVQFRGWMRLVVQTTALDHLRRERRRLRRETALVTAGPSSVGQDDVAADIEEENSHRGWLVEQIAQFDPQLVRIIELRYEQRWTLAKIAGAVGLSIGTVDGRLRRAIGELRRRASGTFEDVRE